MLAGSSVAKGFQEDRLKQARPRKVWLELLYHRLCCILMAKADLLSFVKPCLDGRYGKKLWNVNMEGGIRSGECFALICCGKIPRSEMRCSRLTETRVISVCCIATAFPNSSVCICLVLLFKLLGFFFVCFFFFFLRQGFK